MTGASTCLQCQPRMPLFHAQILKHTPSDHSDYGNLEDALQRAEELCSQVNEGVREKENSDRLEWIQRHVHCGGLAEVRQCCRTNKQTHHKQTNKQQTAGFAQVRENWKSQGKSENIFQSLESRGI